MKSALALIATFLLAAAALVLILTWATGCQKAVNVDADHYKNVDHYKDVDPDMTDRVHDTIAGAHLRYVRDPQTDLCFAYSYIANDAGHFSTGGPVVVLVPCDAVPKEAR